MGQASTINKHIRGLITSDGFGRSTYSEVFDGTSELDTLEEVIITLDHLGGTGYLIDKFRAETTDGVFIFGNSNGQCGWSVINKNGV